MLKETDVAPDFTLTADDGATVRLSDFRGRRVVLFFYPRADTPGCTIEACEFRDRIEDYDAGEAVVLGISPDPVKDVRAFREKFGLPYRLLADGDHQVAEAYGVWKEKTMFGNRFWGVERSTFVIDEEGRLTRIYRKVKPEGHAAEVLQSL
ncbi:MAG: thioredoxin-dependent thiol peroxidase [Gemmatimonas sp.]|nr:thioredoxin-dependent thiol peroxidase [Gemmatimonas sp.]